MRSKYRRTRASMCGDIAATLVKDATLNRGRHDSCFLPSSRISRCQFAATVLSDFNAGQRKEVKWNPNISAGFRVRCSWN
jgi:hypothetical protein